MLSDDLQYARFLPACGLTLTCVSTYANPDSTRPPQMYHAYFVKPFVQFEVFMEKNGFKHQEGWDVSQVKEEDYHHV